MRWIRTAHSDPSEQVGLVRASVDVAATMEHLADLDAATKQIVAGGLNVGDDQIKVSRVEPGAAAVTFLPKMTEHPEPGGVN